jgi:hypothetical protein
MKLKQLIREMILTEIRANSTYSNYYYKYTSPFPDMRGNKSKEEFIDQVNQKNAKKNQVQGGTRNSVKVSHEFLQELKKYDKEQIKMGLKVEKEHDRGDDVDVVQDKLELLKIVIAHLREDPQYYTKLLKAKL